MRISSEEAKHARTPLAAVLTTLLLAPLALALLAAPASATVPGLILAMNTSPDVPNSLNAAGIPQCTPTNGPFCYELRNPAALTVNDFAGRQVVYVGWSASAVSGSIAALNARAAWIDAFVSGGGGLVVSSQNTQGATAYAFVPQGTSFAIQNSFGNDVNLLQSTHGTMIGQTTVSLSNWQSSYHNWFVSWPTYLTHVLAETNAHNPVSLAGPYGAGCVFVTGQDFDWHAANTANAAARTLVRNALDWGSRCGCDAGEPCNPTLTVKGRASPVPVDDDLAPEIRFHDHDEGSPGLVGVDPCVGTIDPASVTGPDPLGLGAPVAVVELAPIELACLLTDAGVAPAPKVPAPEASLAPAPRYPSYVGPVRIALKPCQCVIEKVGWSYVTTFDVAPTNDGIGPLVSQPAANTWEVKSVDGDTYLVTFTVTLKCPDGTKTISKTFYVR